MMTTNRYRSVRTVLCLIFLSLCGACASTQETSTLQQSVTMLHERQVDMERRMEGVDTQSRKGGDLYARIEELQVRMGRLDGRIDELNYKIDQLARSASTPPPASAPQTQVTPPPVASPGPPSPPPQSYGAPHQAPPPAAPPPERENPEKVLYDRALQSFQQGKYDVARKEFQSFLSKYPSSDLADNALFTVGECYYAEKKYQDSIEVYQQVLDKYPKGNKTPHALLKQGSAFQQLGDNTAARILLERLVEKYPGTPQAQAADKKLKQMP